MVYLMVTSEQLKNCRLAKKWSTRQMAAYLMVSQSAYRNYENNKREMPEEVQDRVQKAFINYNGTMAIALDYLRISFEHLSARDVVMLVMKMNIDDFAVGGGNSGMLYRESLNYSGFNFIRVFSRTEPDEKGALLQISGHGCRSFEFILDQQATDWKTFLYDAVYKYNGVVTRIDLAINDYCGWFDIATLIEKAQSGDVKTRFRTQPIIHGNQYSGWTLEFGKRGNVFFRFYEKDKEIASKLGTSNYDLGIINRYELQIADTRKATQLINDWLLKDQLVPMVYGYFNRYITFYDALPLDEEGNPIKLEFKDREVWEPWHYFIFKSKVVKFETLPEEISIDRSLAWIKRSVAPTLKFIKMVQGLDMPDRFGKDLVSEYVDEAELSPRQEKYYQAIIDEIESQNAIARTFEEAH
ncbi:XRE family transcriptional regulator [Weissella viridescens]|uniref:XRE family transcriptional regulator n=2 Tax=Weissella viridescens TaxID=1629 RepID=A0A3P2RI23_WEIVI|nr:XRE family transcriptional regulator [Weissella viridescens]